MRIKEVVVDTDLVDPTKNPDEEFFYVDISSIDNKRGEIIDYKRLKGFEAPSRARKCISENDIIVSTVRPNLNATAIVPKELDNQVCSTGFCVLRSNGRVIPDYLYYYTRTPVFIKSLMSKAKGASYPAVSVEDVKQVEIPIFSIEEQRKIVTTLKSAHTLIKKREQANQMTNKLSKAVFLQMFGEPSKNPNKYPISSLENICSYISDGSHGTPSFIEKGIPFITVRNVGENGIDFTNCNYISRESYEKLKRTCNPKIGDVLFSKDGTVGKVVSIDFHKEFIILSSLAILRPDSKILNQKFLEYLLKNESILKQAIDMKSGSAIRRIIVRDIKCIKVPTPPKELQDRFALVVERANRLIYSQTESTKEINRLFNALISQAFTGELVS